ncbi:MAG: TlpA family protein disulfide reductase [Thermodesulfovibrio sp.]|nr:TlpA family protein disulfide reductase [Thermodesulfovibrio sp.]
MKKNVFLILFVLLAIVFTGSIILKKSKNNLLEAQVGLPAPQFELYDINGKTISLSSLKGKIVILNFWASWCSDCKEEKKSIQNLLNQNKNLEDIVFITVLFRDNPAQVKEMLKKTGYTFTVLIDDGLVSKVYGVKGVPETFLIDKNGVLRRKIIGPIKWDDPHIMPHLRKVLS